MYIEKEKLNYLLRIIFIIAIVFIMTSCKPRENNCMEFGNWSTNEYLVMGTNFELTPKVLKLISSIDRVECYNLKNDYEVNVFPKSEFSKDQLTTSLVVELKSFCYGEN